MITLNVCINRIEIVVDRPLGEVEQQLKHFCRNSLFGVELLHIKGISEGLYMARFPIARDAKEIAENLKSFFEARNFQVSLKIEF